MAVMPLWRLFAAGIVMAREGVFAIVPTDEAPPPVRLLVRLARLIERRSAKKADMAARLSRALDRLGPSYIKLGQFLATRADVVGDGPRVRDDDRTPRQRAKELATHRPLAHEVAQMHDEPPRPDERRHEVRLHAVRVHHLRRHVPDSSPKGSDEAGRRNESFHDVEPSRKAAVAFRIAEPAETVGELLDVHLDPGRTRDRGELSLLEEQEA